MFEAKVTATIGDWVIIEVNNQTFFIDTDYKEVKEIVEVARITLNGNETESQLFDGELIPEGTKFDITGQLDNEPIYCYWRIVDTI